MDQRLKVVPNSLNYADVKPESIQTDIRLTRFVPTATVTEVRNTEPIKFFLTGTGFLDPYSTYLDFTVVCPDLAANEIRFLDRSAHSFINQLIIRSQGVEVERIEDYDILCAMMNDMIYSNEQNSFHQWEGFPSQSAMDRASSLRAATSVANLAGEGQLSASFQYGDAGDASSRCFNDLVYPNAAGFVGVPPFNNVGSGGAGAFDGLAVEVGNQDRSNICRLLSQSSNKIIQPFMGEQAFFNTVTTTGPDLNLGLTLQPSHNAAQLQIHHDRLLVGNEYLDFDYHTNGVRRNMLSHSAVNNGGRTITYEGQNRFRFCVPLYSSVIGVLMQDKKLIPLGLLPLEIELRFNVHALYSCQVIPGYYSTVNGENPNSAFIPTNAATAQGAQTVAGSRNYIFTDINLYGNLVFFETEIHRRVEVQTAERGLFIYANSFLRAPPQTLQGQTIPQMLMLNQNLKSVNSLHFVFLNNQFQNNPQMRKLHFLSHNLTKLQFRNGQNRYPMYEIIGNSGSSKEGDYIPFFLELLRAHNKMHDPKTDCALAAYNFCGDTWISQYIPPPVDLRLTHKPVGARLFFNFLMQKQGNIGRCQYGISLEGEELGQEKQIITGKKLEQPCLLELMSGGKAPLSTLFENQPPQLLNSQLYLFFRYDFVIYIRPDMQVVVLGK